MKKFLSGVATVVVFIAVIIGCNGKTIPYTALEITGGVAGTATRTPGAAVGTPTATKTVGAVVSAGFIDDCNDGDNANQTTWATGQFGMTGPGYWYTFNDWASCCPAGNSVVWPLANTECAYYTPPAGTTCGTFYMQHPGCDGAGNDDPVGYAARMTGSVTNAYVYGGAIGMGINLIGEILPGGSVVCSGAYGPSSVNISGYTGIKFWAKGDGKSYIIKIPYADDCNNSLDGYNDFAYTFTAPVTWTLITVPYTLFATASWGTPPSDLETVVLPVARSIQWATPSNMGATITVDLAIDDIQLY